MFRREEIQVSLFIGDIIVYVENKNNLQINFGINK